MLTHLKHKIRQAWKPSKRIVGDVMTDEKYWTFRGSENYFIKNGACILDESISLFHAGRTNPIRYFSVNDLNNMNVERVPHLLGCWHGRSYYKGCWEGRVVLVQHCSRDYYNEEEPLWREIVVGSMMQTHNNARKILGCCIETKDVVIVYEWESSAKTLGDCLQVLNWEDRLRIAWEISHVVAYLHTAFRRPIVHTNLTLITVYLCQDNTVKLGDFSYCKSIPEGEEFVEDGPVRGTLGYLDPEYLNTARVAEKIDVYSFGMLFLVLLAGKKPIFTKDDQELELKPWVLNGIKENGIQNIIDPLILRNGVTPIEELQLTTSIHLALLCIDDEGDRRPSMVEVATQLHNLIRSPLSISISTTFKDANSSPKARSSLTDDINMEGDNDDDMGGIDEWSIMSALDSSVITSTKDSSQSCIINETSTPEPSIVAQLQRQLQLNTMQALCDALQQLLDELKTKGNNK